MRQKIIRRTVDGAVPGEKHRLFWDTELRGFGLTPKTLAKLHYCAAVGRAPLPLRGSFHSSYRGLAPVRERNCSNRLFIALGVLEMSPLPTRLAKAVAASVDPSA
jgi:hypothetical protein